MLLNVNALKNHETAYRNLERCYKKNLIDNMQLAILKNGGV